MKSNSSIRRVNVLPPKAKADCVRWRQLVSGLKVFLFFLLLVSSGPAHTDAAEEPPATHDARFFILENGTDLREFGDRNIGKMLVRIQGQGVLFGEKQRQHYCRIKHDDNVQWALNNLETGELIARSNNAGEVFFGASAAKVFVAAALLSKQKGEFTKAQLGLLVRMIVVSSNTAWRELQRQVGADGTDDGGRAAVDAFIQSMGYFNTRGFQGWWRKPDGTRIHGNELNSLELVKFVYDTYNGLYDGAEVLWHIMQATATGRGRINKYAPRDVYVGGKTGTYDGPNVSPETVKLKNIRARNHVANLKIGNDLYGLAILTNTGSSEDVAVLGGGLMREYLGVDPEINCQAPGAIAP
ncbi:MAG: serine hydrolase [Desulfobacterales bacterium]|nr:serine hydrolase [Desulfobacterales bacterium]